MGQADAILQEVWRIKDTAYKQAGSKSQLVVAQFLTAAFPPVFCTFYADLFYAMDYILGRSIR